MSALEESLLELIRRTVVHLPLDVVRALEAARKGEEEGTNGRLALDVILENIEVARGEDLPVSPETSTIYFYVSLPEGTDAVAFEKSAGAAVAEATKKGYLQAGQFDPVTEKPYKQNVGPGSPHVRFSPSESGKLEVRLVLKGSGAENASTQYSLPDETISAGLDLGGVRRAALDAVIRALGNGSGPGVLGIGIGGDRASGFALAHQQLLRPLNDRNRVAALAKLEKRIVEDANSLGVGPMGFGGKATVLGAKIGAESRPLSSCFVSVSYEGWACRRQGVQLNAKGGIEAWLYEDTSSLPERTEPLPMSVPDPAEMAAKAAKKTAKKTAKKAAKKVAKKVTAKAPAEEPAPEETKKAAKVTKKAVAKKATKKVAKKVAKKAAKKVAKKATKKKGSA